MTKNNFLSAIPNTIIHNTCGYGELEIVEDTRSQKGICYRHKDKTASYGHYAPSWLELYKNLSGFLVGKGHMVIENESSQK